MGIIRKTCGALCSATFVRSAFELCTCACWRRPKYKRLVDDVYPTSDGMPYDVGSMKKLVAYTESNPGKLKNVGVYLYGRAKTDIARSRNHRATVAAAIFVELLREHHQHLQFFGRSCLNTIQALLDTPPGSALTEAATDLLSSLTERMGERSFLYQDVLGLLSGFCALAMSNNAHEATQGRARLHGLRGIEATLGIAEDIADPVSARFDVVIPALLNNIPQEPGMTAPIPSGSRPSSVTGLDSIHSSERTPQMIASDLLAELTRHSTAVALGRMFPPIFIVLNKAHGGHTTAWAKPLGFPLTVFHRLFALAPDATLTALVDALSPEEGGRPATVVRLGLLRVLSVLLMEVVSGGSRSGLGGSGHGSSGNGSGSGVLGEPIGMENRGGFSGPRGTLPPHLFYHARSRLVSVLSAVEPPTDAELWDMLSIAPAPSHESAEGLTAAFAKAIPGTSTGPAVERMLVIHVLELFAVLTPSGCLETAKQLYTGVDKSAGDDGKSSNTPSLLLALDRVLMYLTVVPPSADARRDLRRLVSTMTTVLLGVGHPGARMRTLSVPTRMIVLRLLSSVFTVLLKAPRKSVTLPSGAGLLSVTGVSTPRSSARGSSGPRGARVSLGTNELTSIGGRSTGSNATAGSTGSSTGGGPVGVEIGLGNTPSAGGRSHRRPPAHPSTVSNTSNNTSAMNGGGDGEHYIPGIMKAYARNFGDALRVYLMKNGQMKDNEPANYVALSEMMIGLLRVYRGMEAVELVPLLLSLQDRVVAEGHTGPAARGVHMMIAGVLKFVSTSFKSPQLGVVVDEVLARRAALSEVDDVLVIGAGGLLGMKDWGPGDKLPLYGDSVREGEVTVLFDKTSVAQAMSGMDRWSPEEQTVLESRIEEPYTIAIIEARLAGRASSSGRGSGGDGTPGESRARSGSLGTKASSGSGGVRGTPEVDSKGWWWVPQSVFKPAPAENAGVAALVSALTDSKSGQASSPTSGGGGSGSGVDENQSTATSSSQLALTIGSPVKARGSMAIIQARSVPFDRVSGSVSSYGLEQKGVLADAVTWSGSWMDGTGDEDEEFEGEDGEDESWLTEGPLDAAGVPSKVRVSKGSLLSLPLPSEMSVEAFSEAFMSGALDPQISLVAK